MRGRTHVPEELLRIVERAYKVDPAATEAELGQLDLRRRYGRYRTTTSGVDWGMVLINVRPTTKA